MGVLGQDFRLQFLGFDPSSDQKQRAETILYELFMEAPSKSFVSVAIQPAGKKFKGWVSILSPVQTFSAVAVGASVTEVAENLFAQGLDQFESWKKQRKVEREMDDAIAKDEQERRPRRNSSAELWPSGAQDGYRSSITRGGTNK